MDIPASYNAMPPAKTGDNMERVDLRIPNTTLDLIDELAKESGVDRSAMLRQVIDEGLPVVLRQKSAELEYRRLKQSIQSEEK